ncbi:protein ASPARTIC PROTEASE IN GUARD CELL 1-like [Spinacia oleracea]|uniref:Protein ASPARTIC PROTEASE IN GUARD CELL 1-like n=1 Tax=Spinacia oleracea TaxID=3562 RepID=A0A9R0IWE0_SPIOL|nr:protein ASPARTIC PROTEASE IN GUARD CELL 1-like [Spinacia oleracea]
MRAHSTYEHLLVMPVGIGRNNSITPMLKTELIIDTGSSLTWVQSLPCESCYKQGDQFPYYNRFASETYEAVRCIDVMCRGLPLANHTECSDLAWDSKEPCSYSVLYGDGTTTSGVIGTDKFYFQDPYGLGYQSVMSMPFGVGTSNHIPDRLTLSTPGVTGLMRGYGTLLEKLAVKKFSHCFPRDEHDTGSLSFGEKAKIIGAKVDLIKSRSYVARLTNVYVSGKFISMGINDVLPTEMLFDTGSTTSMLDPKIMDAVVEAIKRPLIKFQPKQVDDFELCYDLIELCSINLDEVAKVTFEFNYATDIDLLSLNLWKSNRKNNSTCLGIHRGPPDLNVFGNNLMRDINIGYTLDEDDLAMYFHRQHCKR